MTPLAIDLFCGLGGWTEGLLAEGYDVIGFDIERHRCGDMKYPAQLVLQDVLTIHGSRFKDAYLIVASPPCQEFSYMAMPWSKAKQKERDLLEGRDDPNRLTALFDACFRIQREAGEAAGKHIPMVVENVRGAQKWVGQARWNYGSFYLWGDVPALMPMVSKRMAFKDDDKNIGRANGEHRWNTEFKLPGNNGPKRWEDHETQRLCDAYKSSGMNWSDRTKHGQDFTRLAGKQAMSDKGQNPDGRKGGGGTWFGDYTEGIKQGGDWFNNSQPSISRRCSSKGNARKAASAMIAKIPLPLSRYIASVYKPKSS